MTTTIEVKGLAELDKVLKSLPAKIEFNVLRGALRAGQKVVQQAAVANAPAQSGALRSSIRIKTNNKATKRGLVRTDLYAGGSTAWYSHIIEFGSGAHYTGTGRSVRKPYIIKASDHQGRRFGSREKRRINHGSEAGALYFAGQMASKVTHPGVKPRLFMTRAAQQLDGPALDAFVAYVRKRLPREVAQHGSARHA